MKNMAFQRVGDYFVLVHNAMAPTEEEWDEWMQQYTYASILVVTDGGAPTASQRKRLKTRVDELRASPSYVPNKKEPKVAIVTASSFVRGVITALRWFYHDSYAAFPPDHINQALTYLDVPPRYHISMKSTVQAQRLALKKAKVAGQSRTMPDDG